MYMYDSADKGSASLYSMLILSFDEFEVIEKQAMKNSTQMLSRSADMISVEAVCV